MSSRTIATILTMRDKASSVIKKFSNNVSYSSKEIRRANLQIKKFSTDAANHIGRINSTALKLGTTFGALGAAVFIKGGLTQAADLEGYRLTLETVMKDTKKAKSLMKWGSAFANKTPFENAEIVEGIVKLQSYGIEAKKTLPAIGDMAAVMGKSLDQGVEAIADAQTGELERLKEFGITKNMIIKQAEKLRLGLVVNNKNQIVDQEKFNKAMFSIMNEKFKGGMDKQSTTLKGLLSTVGGNVKSFMASVVGVNDMGDIEKGGLFDYLKSQVSGLVESFNRWQKDGTMDAIKTKISNVFKQIIAVIKNTIKFVKENKKAILGFAKAFAILWTVISVLAAIAKFIMLIKNIIAAFKIVFVALGAVNPVTWIVAGVIAVIVAIGLLVANFNKVKSAIKFVIDAVRNWFSGLSASTQAFIKVILLAVTLLFTGWIGAIIAGGLFIYKHWETIWTTIKNVAVSIGTGISTTLNSIMTGISQFITSTITGISTIWTSIWTGVSNTFSNIWNGIKNTASTILNGIIGLINNVINGINQVTNFSLPKSLGGGKVGITIPNIPSFASGTKYFTGGIAQINEKGGEIRRLSSGESILPADRSKQLIDKAKTGTTIHVTIQGNVIGEESYINRLCGAIADKVELALTNV